MIVVVGDNWTYLLIIVLIDIILEFLRALARAQPMIASEILYYQ